MEKEPTYQNILVTPKIASELLKYNTVNRDKKDPRVLLYANEMLAGRWKKHTGETIKISKTKKLLDGQHRLLAVIRANVPVWFTIVTGLDDDIFDVIDTGSNRNACDIFKIAGIKYHNTLPRTIAIYNQIKIGKPHNLQVNNKSTNSQLLAQCMEDKERWENIARLASVWSTKFHKIMTASVVGGIYAVLSERNEKISAIFMEKLCTGIDCVNTVHTLREKLIANNNALNPFPQSIILGLFIKAWNLFCEGNLPGKRLTYNPDVEKFPIPKTPLIF